MPLFFTAKEDRNRLIRSPPGSLRRTRPLVPRISTRNSPPRTKGALLLDAQPPAEPAIGDTAIGSPVRPQDNILPVQTPPPQDTHLSDDIIVSVNSPIHTPVHSPVQSDTRRVGVYYPHNQENPGIEDIITRTRRQVALAAEAEGVADRAIEAARAAVEEARRLLGELERQIGAE